MNILKWILTIFMSFSLLTACGNNKNSKHNSSDNKHNISDSNHDSSDSKHNDSDSDHQKIGQKLDCKQSGWLDNESLIGKWSSEEPFNQKQQSLITTQSQQIDYNNLHWRTPTFIMAGSEEGAIPRISIGALYNINLDKENEETAKKWLGLDISTIKNLGYDGEYGGFVTFNPVADGLYRVYSNKKLWFNLLHLLHNRTINPVFATRYINCFEKEHESIQLVVEFSLKGGENYGLHFVNAKEDSFKLLILSAH